MSNNSIKKFLSFGFWILLLAIAIFLPTISNYQWWAVLVGGLPIGARLAYEHFDYINLLFNRIFLWITNKEVAWEMKVHFRGDYSNYDFLSAFKQIGEKFPSARILQSGDLEKTISIPDWGIVVKILLADVQQDESEFGTELVLVIPRVVVPFRHSAKTLNALITVVDYVRKSINCTQEKYEFKAIFGESNPYLGLFLRRLQVMDSTRLNVEYSETEGANHVKVVVSKGRVSLVTRDLQSLQAFSKKYITLASLNLSDA